MLSLRSSQVTKGIRFLRNTVIALSLLFHFSITCLAQDKKSPWAENQLLVKLKAKKVSGLRSAASSSLPLPEKLDSLNKRHGCYVMRPLHRYNNTFSNTNRSARIRKEAYKILYFDATIDLEYLVEQYKASGLFEFVEPNYIGHAAATMRSESLPDDQFLARQWYIENDGSFSLSPSKEDADIDLKQAWEITQGDPSVIVAMLDTGIDPNHPEFDGRIWVNDQETDQNSLDDDGNGYVDDMQGWNFVSNNNIINDDNRHGTHVTGVLGATGNNGFGYAGVDWNCKIMVCKVLDNDLSGFYSWWIEGIFYAVDNGAKVINMSLGGETYSELLKEAVDYAFDNGVIVVSSMQNDNVDTPFYPAAYANTIAVGSTDPDDKRSISFVRDPRGGSNYGPHIDVVAPGNYIYGLTNNDTNNYEAIFGGTSLSAPIVSGIASLLIAQDATITANELRSKILRSSEDQVGDPAEDTQGWDIYHGFGRVNAYQALRLSEVEEIGQAKIFPVPSPNKIININYTLPGTSFLNIYLTTPQGKTVILWKGEEIRTYRATISLNSFNSGLYIITLESRFGLINKKIII